MVIGRRQHEEGSEVDEDDEQIEEAKLVLPEEVQVAAVAPIAASQKGVAVEPGKKGQKSLKKEKEKKEVKVEEGQNTRKDYLRSFCCQEEVNCNVRRWGCLDAISAP